MSITKAGLSVDDDLMIECLGDLISCYARMRAKTYLDVTNAVLASRTLAERGYSPSQKGVLTHDQLRGALSVLSYWIGVEVGKI